MTNQHPIRVRFAPSPTGYLHVGGLRTALYNFLFARKHDGSFILRIEDTDRSRQVEGATENLVATLRWAGLDYDEGPGKGGNFGPYVQSERLELYRRHAKELVDNGSAYLCFCAPEELEAMRKAQMEHNEPVRYDRRCRALSSEEVNSRMAKGAPYVIRLKVPMFGDIAVNDIIRGNVTFQFNVLDDQVLLKSDGFPTYHLANVVDDHHMQITHIIRGEEWLPSVPKHVLIYQALDWEVPQYAHLPLLLNPDRSKLSKRQGDIAVEDYRAKGYLPEALVNYLALLGWSESEDREFYTLSELVEAFSLERVGKAGAIFDVEKLRWMNGQYFRHLPLERRMDACRPYLEAAGYDISDEHRYRKIIEALTPRIQVPVEAPEKAELFFSKHTPAKDVAEQFLYSETGQKVLHFLLDKLRDIEDVTGERFSEILGEAKSSLGVKGKNLFMPVRIALTGEAHGPELPLVAEILGKEECLNRLREEIQA